MDELIQVYANAEGVQAKIRSRLPNCSRGERRVAEYILESPSQVIYQSVTEVGVATETSEATVIRFCQSLGYRGYHEFKVALAQDLVVPTPAQSEDIRTDDPLPAIASKLLTHNIQVLQDTMRVLDMEQLERAVDAVTRARKVEFYGVGASGVTAADARYKFLRIGTLCDAPPDPNIQAMSAAMLTPQDVAVGISWSGSNKDTLHVLNNARQAGARVIAVTNFVKSPVTEVADVVLLTASRETPAQSGSLASKIAQIFVLDLLFTGVVMRNQEKARLANEKAGRAILERMV
ncbi:MAG: RpiR4 [Symbiobacteriaceae bacterium]|nr:RpiR4 [Symbiobacteriaceae bacterium]